MIDHVISTSPWINSSGGSSNLPYITGGEDPMRGVVRVMNGRIEAWSGAGWISIPSNSAYIDVSDSGKTVLEWAEKKMQEEARSLALAEKHPAVADAVAQLHNAEEQLKVVIALTQENT